MVIDHISYSQIQMLLRCGVQYEFRYINGMKIPPPGRVVRGTVGHKALAHNFSQKILSKQDVPVQEIKDVFSDIWEQEKYNISFTDEELQGDSPTKAAGKLKDSGIAMIEAFHEKESPLVQPAAVEDYFEVEFEGDYPKLIGYIDRIDEDECGEPSIISEVKFLSKTPPKDDVKKDLQLTVYDMGFRSKYGRPPKKLKKQFAVDLVKPKADHLEEISREQDTLRRLMFRIQAVFDALQKGIFLPADHGSWACSYCGYAQLCNYRP